MPINLKNQNPGDLQFERFLTLKKLLKVEISQLNAPNIQYLSSKMPKIGQNMAENVFYALLLVLSGRFGDPVRVSKDSECILETPG